jgi:hypothetical protein
VTAAIFAKQLYDLGACKEGRDWVEAAKIPDIRVAYQKCPAAEFMCWTMVRVMGLDGARAPVAVAAGIAQLYREPLLPQTLDLCSAVIDKKSSDTRQLQILAYDAAALAATTTKGSGQALMSAAYAAYCVSFAIQSQQLTDPELQRKAILKAASHASDCAARAWEAAPGVGAALPQVVREAVKEETLAKAFAKATGG